MLHGFIDSAGRKRMHGWVRDDAYPAASVSLLVTANDRLIGRAIANVHRADLAAAGIGDGRFGFELAFNPPLSPARSWLLHVRSEATGEDVPGSPLRLPASSEFDDTARRAFSATMDGFASAEELDDRIGFLAAERDRLLQVRADLRSQRTERATARLLGSHTGPGLRRRALVVDQRVPEPDRDGGSNALVSHMRSLQRLGYEVTFAAQSMAGGEAAAALERQGIACCHAPWSSAVEDVLRREADTFDLVYLHRVAVAAAYATLVRQCQRRAHLVYSVADLHHLRLARQATAEDRPELRGEAERTRLLELFTAHGADSVITHSTAEATLLRRTVPAGLVHVVPWTMPIRPRSVPFEKRHGLAFIGHFAHAPNAAAARQLRDEIMPLVRRQDPSITCRLVGDALPASLQAAAPGMEYAGHVPDLDDLFDSVRLTVSPLQFGAGLKGKVLASLAAGVPCVCSPIAAEGMELPPRLQDLVVPDIATAVRTILRLHDDEAYNARLARRSLAFADRTLSEAAVDAAMRRAVGAPAAQDQAAAE